MVFIWRLPPLGLQAWSPLCSWAGPGWAWRLEILGALRLRIRVLVGPGGFGLWLAHRWGFGLVHALGPCPSPGVFGALVELGASLADEEVFAIFLQVLSTLTFVCWVMLCMS